MSFSPLDPLFEARVRASFARQQAMHTIGATLSHVAPGEVEVALPYRADLTQQQGFLHAGIVATILDSACGYSAFSLMAADVAVLTVEYKTICSDRRKETDLSPKGTSCERGKRVCAHRRRSRRGQC